MQEKLIMRMLNITRKQTRRLLEQSSQINNQVQQLEDVLSRLKAEYHNEQNLSFEMVMGVGRKQQLHIYDHAPYLAQMERRQQQVRSAISECKSVLQQIQNQLRHYYQQEQQYLKFLAQHQAMQAVKSHKIAQNEADECVRLQYVSNIASK